MKAHGNGKPRVRRSVFLAFRLRSPRSSPTSSSTDATIVASAAARHHRGYRGPPAPKSINVSATRSAALVEGLTKLKRLSCVARGQAGRELAQAVAGDRRRRPRSLDQARDRLHNMRTLEFVAAHLAPPDRRGDARHLCAARGRMGMQEMREELETSRSALPDPEAYACGDATARCARGAQPIP